MNFVSSLALSAYIASLTFFSGTAHASPSPWTDCGFKHPNKQVRLVDCRINENINGQMQVQWADGETDTFERIRSRILKDAEGGIWAVERDEKEGEKFLLFESLTTGTIFLVFEW